MKIFKGIRMVRGCGTASKASSLSLFMKACC